VAAPVHIQSGALALLDEPGELAHAVPSVAFGEGRIVGPPCAGAGWRARGATRDVGRHQCDGSGTTMRKLQQRFQKSCNTTPQPAAASPCECRGGSTSQDRGDNSGARRRRRTAVGFPPRPGLFGWPEFEHLLRRHRDDTSRRRATSVASLVHNCVGMQKRRPSGGPAFGRPPRRIASDRRAVLALWYLAAYLLIVYAAIRWGHPPGSQYPGSD
jgi:hypothetical protein